MSALGQKPTNHHRPKSPFVRFGPKADIGRMRWQVRQGPEADIGRARSLRGTVTMVSPAGLYGRSGIS